MKTNLTQKRLKKVLHYNLKTGIFIWKIAIGCVAIGKKAGSKHRGYLQIKVDGVLYYAHRLAWLYVYGYFPENDLDHKDRIKHHNWISNLREASRSCNMRNTINRKTNTSRVKGVCWAKHVNKWTAQITINYEHFNLGVYKDFNNAVCARLAAEQCLGWGNCDSSSPAFQYVQDMLKH